MIQTWQLINQLTDRSYFVSRHSRLENTLILILLSMSSTLSEQFPSSCFSGEVSPSINSTCIVSVPGVILRWLHKSCDLLCNYRLPGFYCTTDSKCLLGFVAHRLLIYGEICSRWTQGTNSGIVSPLNQIRRKFPFFSSVISMKVTSHFRYRQAFISLCSDVLPLRQYPWYCYRGLSAFGR